MLGLDILVFSVVFLVIVGGSVTAIEMRRHKREQNTKMVLQEKGKHNLEALVKEDELTCTECLKPVNPDVDLYIEGKHGGAWFHRGCYHALMK